MQSWELLYKAEIESPRPIHASPGAWTPSTSFSPSSLLSLGSHSIQLHWESSRLCDFYSIDLSNFLGVLGGGWVVVVFFLPPSLTFLSLPQTLVSSSWHDEHSSFNPKWFCLLLPQFSYLSLLFLYSSLFTVHSKASQPTVEYPKLTPSLKRCQEGRETEGSTLALSDFFWAGRMTVNRSYRSRDWQGWLLFFRFTPERRNICGGHCWYLVSLKAIE